MYNTVTTTSDLAYLHRGSVQAYKLRHHGLDMKLSRVKTFANNNKTIAYLSVAQGKTAARISAPGDHIHPGGKRLQGDGDRKTERT